MSFEHNPADEDREAYDSGLMAEEITSLRKQLAEANEKNNELARAGASSIIRNAELSNQLAAQAAELERLRDERDHYEASSKRWLEISRNLFKLKCTYRQECASKDAELERLREAVKNVVESQGLGELADAIGELRKETEA